MAWKFYIGTSVAFVCAVLAAIYLPGFRNAEAVSAVPAAAKHRVKLAEVKSVESFADVSFYGVVRPVNRAKLSFPRNGHIDRRAVYLGDRVRKGQFLASLYDRGLASRIKASQAALREARETFAQAERSYNRLKQLEEAAADTVSRDSLDLAESRKKSLALTVEKLRWELAFQEKQLEELHILAPFSGTVTYVGPEEQEYVISGQTVLAVSSDELEIEIKIPDLIAEAVKIGETVEVQPSLTETESFRANVSAIARPTYGLERLATLVVALAENSRLASQGMAAEVIIQRPSENVLTVPIEAILAPNSARQELFIVADGKARSVTVTLERFLGEEVVVKGELAAGDKVVVQGNTALLEGDALEFALESH